MQLGLGWAQLGHATHSCPHPCPPGQDQKVQLTVLTDRSQGGSSVLDGSLELMVRWGHRGGTPRGRGHL